MKQEQWKLSYKGKPLGEVMTRDQAESKLLKFKGVLLGLELMEVVE